MNMIQRPRRLRISAGMRDLVRETELSPRDFVYPIFVVPGEHIKEEIPSMPGCFHYSVDNVAELARLVASCGIPAVEVFGLPDRIERMGSREPRTVGDRRDQGSRSGASCRRGRLPLPIYQSWALRRTARQIRGQRCDTAASRSNGGKSGACGRGHRSAVRHDGWTRCGDSRGA